MKPAHIALAVLVMAVWASNIAAARFAASEIPGWALITVRMMVIAVSLLPFVSIPRGYMWKIFWLSVTMGTLHFGLMFVAIQHIYVGTAALIIQTSVPFALLLALLSGEASSHSYMAIFCQKFPPRPTRTSSIVRSLAKSRGPTRAGK